MKITNQLTDAAVFTEVGRRLAQARLQRGLTQEALAQEAGVGKRTVERLEAGKGEPQLSVFLRVCRVLGLLERLDAILPEQILSPLTELQLRGRTRKRVRSKKGPPASERPWKWGDST